MDSNSNRSSKKSEITFSIIDIFHTLAKRIKIILIVPIILCSLSIIYVQFFASHVYTSTSKIMSSANKSSSKLSQAAGLAAQFGLNISSGQSEANWSYSEILKSRFLAKKVLKRKFSTNKFGQNKTLLQILTFGNDEPEFNLDTLEILGAEALIKKIKVSEDIKTSVFTITTSFSEPKLAQEINSAIIAELDLHQQDYNKSKTSKTKQFIEERIFDVESELKIAEEALRDFTTRNRRIDNSALLLLEQQRLTREVNVLIGVFTSLKQQLENAKIEEVKESNYVVIIDPPEIPLKREKPNKKLIVVLFGILGLGTGAIVAFITDFYESVNKRDKNKLSKVYYTLVNNLKDLRSGKIF